MFLPMIPLILRPAPDPSVRPRPKVPRPAGPPPPAPDPEHPMGSEVLRHLEEWRPQDAGEAAEGPALRSGVLEHLEQWAEQEASEILGRPIEPESRAGTPGAPAPRAPDREHPLWDRELDG